MLSRLARGVTRPTLNALAIHTSRSNRAIFDIESESDFETRVMKSEQAVVVSFHADWCEPCRVLMPKLEELVGPMADVHLAKVDVERIPQLVEAFEVKAVPAVLAVKNGRVVDKFLGLLDSDALVKFMKKVNVGK